MIPLLCSLVSGFNSLLCVLFKILSTLVPYIDHLIVKLIGKTPWCLQYISNGGVYKSLLSCTEFSRILWIGLRSSNQNCNQDVVEVLTSVDDIKLKARAVNVHFSSVAMPKALSHDSADDDCHMTKWFVFLFTLGIIFYQSIKVMITDSLNGHVTKCASHCLNANH